MHGAMVAVGTGALIGWSALPLLSHVAVRAAQDPRLRYRALILSLLLSNALLLAPWIRVLWPSVPARLAPVRVILLPAPASLDAHAMCCLAEAIGAMWLVLVFWSSIRTVHQLTQLRRTARLGRPARGALLDRVRLTAAQMRIDAPAVVVVDSSDVPFVTGAFKPTLVVPRFLLGHLQPAALDFVIRHELAHLVRKDLHWSALIAAACIPFRWHPTLRRVLRELALAREEAVDSLVGSGSPCAYARMLVDVAEAVSCRPRALMIGVEPSELERRIARLFQPGVEQGTSSIWRVVAVAAVLFLGSLVAPRLGLQPASTPRTTLHLNEVPVSRTAITARPTIVVTDVSGMDITEWTSGRPDLCCSATPDAGAGKVIHPASMTALREPNAPPVLSLVRLLYSPPDGSHGA